MVCEFTADDDIGWTEKLSTHMQHCFTDFEWSGLRFRMGRENDNNWTRIVQPTTNVVMTSAITTEHRNRQSGNNGRQRPAGHDDNTGANDVIRTVRPASQCSRSSGEVLVSHRNNIIITVSSYQISRCLINRYYFRLS